MCRPLISHREPFKLDIVDSILFTRRAELSVDLGSKAIAQGSQ